MLLLIMMIIFYLLLDCKTFSRRAALLDRRLIDRHVLESKWSLNEFKWKHFFFFVEKREGRKRRPCNENGNQVRYNTRAV